MEKVLILSCSTGQGHDSCAKAVKEYFDDQNVYCEVRDALEFDSKRLARFMSWGHSFMYRYLPWLFRRGYSYSENHSALFGERSLIFRMLTSGSDKIYDYISKGGFDTIICTHVFSAMILTYMKKLHPIDVRTSFVATDYTCSPSMEKSDLQYYFIPHESLIDEFAKCGIPKERIFPVGIPVRTDFVRRTDKREAKKLLNIAPDSRHLLVMCGSMGCGPISKTALKLSKILPDDVEVTVVCGTNERLYKKLMKKHKNNDRIHIVGYTDKISLYMDATDLYLTKPGGISSTEAAMKRVPMLLADVVAGCELHNMRFFGDMGAAVIEKSLSKLAERSMELIRNTQKLQQMEKNLENYNQSVGTKGIFDNLKD